MTHLRDLSASFEPLLRVAARHLFSDPEWQTGGSDKPFLLAGNVAWLIEEGSVDVFVVASAGRLGRRAHLCRAEAGQIVVGVDVAGEHSGRVLLGVGTRDARMRKVSLSALRAHARRPENRDTLYPLVDQWVETLCSAWRHETVPTQCTEFEPGTEMAVTLPTAARPRREVTWVRHTEGHSALLGLDALTVNGTGYVPLSQRGWLMVSPESRMELVTTATLPDSDAIWDGLERLHSLVLRFGVIRDQRAAKAATARLHRKETGRQLALQDACADLVSSTRRDDSAAGDASAPPEPQNEDPGVAWHAALTVAAQCVGRALGVTIQVAELAAPDAHESRDSVSAIARASRLRTRIVALRDEWWRHDNGPLLAFIGETKRPAALVYGRRGYVLHDPLRGEESALTPAVAGDLQPFAHTFYRPFPDKALNILAVVRSGLRDCGRDGVMVFGSGLIAALIGLVPAVCTGAIFNTILPSADRLQLVQVSVILVSCGIASALFTLVRGTALLRIESRMSVSIQAAVWDRLLSLPMPFFRPYASGDLAMRAMGIDSIRQVISGTVITAILGGLFSLCNFALMFVYSPVMAWWATLLIAVAVLATVIGSVLQLRHQRGIAAIQMRISGLVLQLLSSIGKLRVAGAEVTAFTLWAKRFAEQRQLQFRARGIGITVGAFNAAFPVLASMMLFWIALPLIHSAQPTMRTGDFLAFLSAYGSCQGALLATCMALLNTLNVVPLYEQAKPILQAIPEVDQSKTEPGRLAGDIEIQSVTFRYVADGPPVLRGLSLRIRPGEFVAFVGPSGSGKSTILRLLLGFELPESGTIYYDGQDLGGLDIQAVRRQFGVVLQGGRLTSGDIFSNIVGSAPLSVSDAWTAARMAGFADDVEAMPMGMHTVVSEGGGTLSGGQRQRLMIARALVRQPRLLFFDEATSALDNRTQAVVSASLGQLHATRIVVAHRLSTILHADRICVIDRGQIVQSGQYDELMAQPGLFADLAKRQLV
ncbi:MAG: NHLP bacteriocin export ABC transporter permease/ATPase subunit [bacterium]